MHPLHALSVFWLLPLALTQIEDLSLDHVPRKSVPFHRVKAHLFHEEGVFNYSTMLLREDLHVLMLGAREAVYALDLNNISKKLASVKWEVTNQKKTDCQYKGKDPEIECKNYIRILHKMDDNRMYVCGTNAFDPECDYMSYADGKLTLENRREDGKGKCPFDPSQRYASIMVGNNLYSATSMNFLGSEPVLMRSSPVSIRTEFKSFWLNEPSFVSMAQMPEGVSNEEGDDDKVYLFFTEKAVEYDCYKKLLVSRVARVCKGDIGGQRTLQKKWTSFLKASLECPVLESQMPYIIQDTYLWCQPQKHWKSCLFYAVFTPQSDTSGLSAVCVYDMSDISKMFAEGKYKTRVTVETSFVKWVMYSGDVPVPRPGACINNEARKMGINTTLDLPDRTLQFIKDRPLMDQAIQPIGRKPVLVRRGAEFTRIVVNQVQAADGENYHVMFIGTEDSKILKAVNYEGEMFIIEEIEIFQASAPVKILKLSNAMGQLYAGSDYGVAQIPLASCERSLTCFECVLARDPYCGWDKVIGKCVDLANSQRQLIQSLKDGKASLCPDADAVKPLSQSIWPGGNLKLSCPLPSNLAKARWEWNGSPLSPSAQLLFLQDGLLILNASQNNGGRYRCLSVEQSKTDQYTATVAEYKLTVLEGDTQTLLPRARRAGSPVALLHAVIGILVIALLALLAWNFYKGHLPLPWNCWKKNRGQESPAVLRVNSTEARATVEVNPLMSSSDDGRKNNHHTREAKNNAAGEGENVPDANLPSLQYIDDESEI